MPKITVNIILSGQKLKIFPLRSGTRQECPLSELLINIMLEVLAQTIKQEKAIKIVQVGKEDKKLSFITDNIIVYVESPEELTKKPPGTNMQLQQGCKIHTLISKVNFEIKYTIPFTRSSPKKEMLRYKSKSRT